MQRTSTGGGGWKVLNIASDHRELVPTMMLGNVTITRPLTDGPVNQPGLRLIAFDPVFQLID